ncbi:MAG: SAM-dependent chlorinase/fluorinase [Bacteroidales bacterium]|nr:SAM-dependent chlorinase/fluorinase [Bacteroidales bacterium]
MPVITLITDRNNDDFILGRLKGQLLSSCEKLSIVDLAHNIKHHSIAKAAFVLKNSYKDFPDNTVHIIGVDGECSENKNHLIAKVFNQYFITADTGLFSLVFEPSEIEKIIEISPCEDNKFRVPALFSFGKIACKIILGKEIDEFGEEATSVKRLMALNPTYDKDYILGHLVYINSYKNAITDINYVLFQEIGRGRPYVIYAGSHSYKINKISNSYQEVEKGDLVAIFNSLGLLEIAMYKGKITEIFSFNYDTKIRIEFYDNKNS